MRIINLLVIILASCLCIQALASEVGSEKVDRDEVFNENFIKDQASALQLSVDEVHRYNEIMASPAGVFYKRGEANIYYVLSAEAKTEQERMKYARLWVDAEAKHYEKLGAAMRSYTKASLERFGKNPVVWDLGAYDDLVSNNSTLISNASQQADKRAKLYVNTKNCPSCSSKFSELMAQLDGGQVSGIDIYFIDASGDRNAISTWASAMKISPDIVRSKIITLNFDDGKFKGKPPHAETYFIIK